MVDPPEEPIHRTGEEASGGRIVLRRRWQRFVFLAGLVGGVLLALVLAIVGIAR